MHGAGWIRRISFFIFCHRSVFGSRCFWWVHIREFACVRISYETQINVRLRSISARQLETGWDTVPCARDSLSLPVYRDRKKREYFEVRVPSFVQKSATTSDNDDGEANKTTKKIKCIFMRCSVCVQLCHCWRWCYFSLCSVLIIIAVDVWVDSVLCLFCCHLYNLLLLLLLVQNQRKHSLIVVATSVCTLFQFRRFV